jgi:hypothetical protein
LTNVKRSFQIGVVGISRLSVFKHHFTRNCGTQFIKDLRLYVLK